jgi:hypothetical protein
MALLVDELGRAVSSEHRSSLLAGIDESLRGRRHVSMPTADPTATLITRSAALEALLQVRDPALVSAAQASMRAPGLGGLAIRAFRRMTTPRRRTC